MGTPARACPSLRRPSTFPLTPPLAYLALPCLAIVRVASPFPPFVTSAQRFCIYTEREEFRPSELLTSTCRPRVAPDTRATCASSRAHSKRRRGERNRHPKDLRARNRATRISRSSW